MSQEQPCPQTCVEMVLALLEDRFPRLASAEEEQVSGADTIDELSLRSHPRRSACIRVTLTTFIAGRKLRVRADSVLSVYHLHDGGLPGSETRPLDYLLSAGYSGEFGQQANVAS